MPLNSFFRRLQSSIADTFGSLNLTPDVGQLEQALLSGAAGGIPGALTSVRDKLGSILPGVPPGQIVFAQAALGLALSALHVQHAAAAARMSGPYDEGTGTGCADVSATGTAAGCDDDEDDDSEGEGPDDPQFEDDRPRGS